nr:replication enhancer protein [West African Asystasia virus 2]
MDSRTGENITAAQAKNGVYTWEISNPLYFKILNHDVRPMSRPWDIIRIQVRFNHNLRKALGIHKCFLTFQAWTSLRPQTSHFLRVFSKHVIRYLDGLGVLSINNVIRAIKFVLYDVLHGTEHVADAYDIKFNIY